MQIEPILIHVLEALKFKVYMWMLCLFAQVRPMAERIRQLSSSLLAAAPAASPPLWQASTHIAKLMALYSFDSEKGFDAKMSDSDFRTLFKLLEDIIKHAVGKVEVFLAMRKLQLAKAPLPTDDAEFLSPIELFRVVQRIEVAGAQTEDDVKRVRAEVSAEVKRLEKLLGVVNKGAADVEACIDVHDNTHKRAAAAAAAKKVAEAKKEAKEQEKAKEKKTGSTQRRS